MMGKKKTAKMNKGGMAPKLLKCVAVEMLKK